MNLNEIMSILSEEEQTYPVALYTGWEGDDPMEVCAVAVLKDGGKPFVFFLYGIDWYMLRNYEIVRIIEISPMNDLERTHLAQHGIHLDPARSVNAGRERLKNPIEPC
jgi:hypothetical protein